MQGREVLRVEVDLFELADALVESGYLRQWDAEDPTKIAEAVRRKLDDWVKRDVTLAAAAHPLPCASKGDADACDPTEGAESGER